VLTARGAAQRATIARSHHREVAPRRPAPCECGTTGYLAVDGKAGSMPVTNSRGESSMQGSLSARLLSGIFILLCQQLETAVTYSAYTVYPELGQALLRKAAAAYYPLDYCAPNHAAKWSP
jgi:hypothetical protein